MKSANGLARAGARYGAPMFGRRTKSRQTDGKAYHTHRPVRSERDGAAMGLFDIEPAVTSTT